MAPSSGIVTTVFAGTVGGTGLPQQQHSGVAGEIHVSGLNQSIIYLFIGIVRGRTSAGITTSSDLQEDICIARRRIS